MGTPEFAVASLKSLLQSNHEIVAVVTTPDKPAGRGQKIHESEVKLFAVENRLKILQPIKLKDPDFIEALQSCDADLFVVVAFRMLPEEVWNMPRLGTINLHASLLPDYRGAAPINRAIMNGERITGLTTFFLTHHIDEGDILFQSSTSIGDRETAGELHDRLMVLGAKLLIDTVNSLAEGNYKKQKQTTPDATKLAPKIFKDTCKINWNQNTQMIHNFIRGLSPYPTAWSILSDQKDETSIKVFKAEPEICEHHSPIGAILSDGKTYLKVACKDGFLSLKEIQLQGKKKLEVKNFLAGFRNIDNYSFQFDES